MYCEDIDIEEHTIIKCPRWEVDRTAINQKIETYKLHENIMKGIENWKNIYEYVRKIMGQKEKEEREGQKTDA